MILVVDAEIFESQTVRDVDRIALLRLAVIRQHTVVCQSKPGTKSPPLSPCPIESWRRGLKDRIAREAKQLHEAIRWSADGTAYGTTHLRVSNRWDERGFCIVRLDVALRILGEPLHILVENGLRDAAFLRCVMPQDWSVQLADWEQRGRVRFEHAGGITSLKNIVDFMITDAGAAQAWGISASAWIAIHFLIYDHDGSTADQPSEQARELMATCKQAGLEKRHHVLQRKKQEYYLPKEAMYWIADKEITNRIEMESMKTAIDRFFDRDDRRCFGQLPKHASPSDKPTERFWKGRFWRHRDVTWAKAWFEGDGCWGEMRDLAEAISRAL
jgi:hypothetical protein